MTCVRKRKRKGTWRECRTRTSTMVKWALRAITDEKLFCVYLYTNEQAKVRKRSSWLSIILESKQGMYRAPENAVPDFVNLPRPDERNVAFESRFHEVPPPVKLPCLLFIPRYLHAALKPTFIVPKRDRTVLDGGRCSCGREERGHACCVGAQTTNEGALRDEFERDFAFKV